MFRFLAWAHALLFRLCVWALTLPLKALLAAVTLVMAWLGEEFRRWAGLAVSGALLILAGKAVLNYAPPQAKQPLALTVLVLLGIWALAVARSARYTLFLVRNNLQPVRTRQTFKRLFGEVGQLGGRLDTVRGEVVKGVARAARGTPAEPMFKSNRAARAKAEADAQAAAERQEAERIATAERVLASQRATEQQAAEEARAEAAKAVHLPVVAVATTRRRRRRRPDEEEMP